MASHYVLSRVYSWFGYSQCLSRSSYSWDLMHHDPSDSHKVDYDISRGKTCIKDLSLPEYSHSASPKILKRPDGSFYVFFISDVLLKASTVFTLAETRRISASKGRLSLLFDAEIRLVSKRGPVLFDLDSKSIKWDWLPWIWQIRASLHLSVCSSVYISYNFTESNVPNTKQARSCWIPRRHGKVCITAHDI